MKTGVVLILATLCSSTTFSQTASDIARNGFYLEAAGNAVFYSINYERRLYVRDSPKIIFRLGFATWLEDLPFLMPMEVNYLFGKKDNFFELGFGRTLVHSNEEDFSVLRLGYRYESENRKRIFRAAFTPLLGITSGDTIQSYPWFGISYGVRF